jgi:hypothetical protein
MLLWHCLHAAFYYSCDDNLSRTYICRLQAVLREEEWSKRDHSAGTIRTPTLSLSLSLSLSLLTLRSLYSCRLHDLRSTQPLHSAVQQVVLLSPCQNTLLSPFIPTVFLHVTEADDRKRGYNSMQTIDVSLEDMEVSE